MKSNEHFVIYDDDKQEEKAFSSISRTLTAYEFHEPTIFNTELIIVMLSIGIISVLITGAIIMMRFRKKKSPKKPTRHNPKIKKD